MKMFRPNTLVEEVVRARSELNPAKFRKIVRPIQKCGMDTIHTFMRTSISPVSSVYLFVVESNIKTKIDVEPNHTLVKYGLTNNLRRRSTEHSSTYGEVSLKYFINVDNMYLKDAEEDVKKFFKMHEWHVTHKNYNELAMVPTEKLDTLVLAQYQQLGELYLNKCEKILKENEALKSKLYYTEQIANEKETIINTYKFFLKN
jgi:hypothetical protein